MNDNNNNGGNQTDMGGTFSGSSPQTNPFTADLKGEFTSNFGTNTNAVSQIFKDGGFVSQRPTKLIIAGIVLVLAAVGLGWYFLSDSEEPEPFPFETAEEGGEAVGEDGEPIEEGDEAVGEEGAVEGEEGEAVGEEGAAEGEAGAAEGEYEGEYAADTGASQAASTGASSATSGSISLIAPSDGQVWQYDETKGAAPFQWDGGGWVIISRSPSMRPEYIRASANSGNWQFKNPYPGSWYWQVENGSGRSEVRRFTVSAPARRNVMVSQPSSGGALAAEGGVVSWQGDEKIAFYRVEMANGSFANPAYKFATSGNSVQVTGVSPGQYQLRVGAFSEIAGRWEYTSPISVSVQ